MHCFISTSAYHAYWRHRGYGRALRRTLIILCTAGFIGGAGTAIKHTLDATIPGPPGTPGIPGTSIFMKVDAP